MQKLINFNYSDKHYPVKPNNEMVKNWAFKENEVEEAKLAAVLAELAEKNGLSKNDLQHVFPAVLRIMKSNSEWSF